MFGPNVTLNCNKNPKPRGLFLMEEKQLTFRTMTNFAVIFIHLFQLFRTERLGNLLYSRSL